MMKRILILGIVLCLLAAAGIASAEGPATEYNQNGFRMTLPEGDWYAFPVDATSTYYFGDEAGTVDQGMIMIQIVPDETLIGVTIPEDTLLAYYDMMKEQLAATAENGQIESKDIRIGGALSRVFWYRGAVDNTGALYAISAAVSFIGANNVVILFAHPSMTAEEAGEIVAAICDSLQYSESVGTETTGSATGTGTASGNKEIPTSDNPAFFDPHSARERNLSTAMWMMDEQSRAYLTMYMMLNTADYELPYQMNVMASWVGSAEDTILIAVPSMDGQNACIYMYNNESQNACFFYQPWSDAALEEFKAACTDQLFMNSEDALVKVAQELLTAVGAYD